MAESTGKSTKTRKTASKAKKPEPAPVDHKAEAKAKFSKALEEAKAGARELTAEGRSRADAYRERAVSKSGDWADEARAYGEQAKAKAGELAVEGKARASDALAGLGKLVSDNAESIDDRFGEKYGDYARSASRKMQETAAKIESKDLDEIGDDAREFVRKSPGLAVGLAAVAGFMLARLFSGSRN
jgi:ElaB/YqjD/DUF883 family membrane-anchored ribosome-binding protein